MIKNLLSDDEPETARSEPTRSSASHSRGGVLGLFDSSGDPTPAEPKTTYEPTSTEHKTDYDPDSVGPRSLAEGVRGMGMAYSAGIAFTAAVIFMLVLGWGADVLLGTSPWGIVGGIILGSVIGFVQFFRITSQIFKK